MGAAELLGTKPIEGWQSRNASSGGVGPQPVKLIPGSAFEANVGGVSQKFNLGVLDGKMVILRNNPKGGYFVLRTDVLAGGQPKQASEQAVSRFNEMLKSPTVVTTDFLRASGAIKLEALATTSAKVPLASKNPVVVNASYFGRQNGSGALALGVSVPTGRGRDAVKFELISAQNFDVKRVPFDAVSKSVSWNYGLSPATELLAGVSQVDNLKTGLSLTTLGLAVRTSINLGSLRVSAEGRFLYVPETGAVTVRPAFSATYTVPLENGVYFDVTGAVRQPFTIGQRLGDPQWAASLGIGYKTKDFNIQARVGTVLPGDAVNGPSALNSFGGGIFFSWNR